MDATANSRSLEDFFSRRRVRLDVETADPVMVSPEVLARLSEWSAASELSQVLWLEGPFIGTEDFENPVTMMAAKFIKLADQFRIPVISYFCQLCRQQNTRPSRALEEEALTALFYALLRQMFEVLPPRFKTNVDFQESRFLRLDGTMDTWKDAMSVFCDLLALMPNGILCVLDGLQWLDDMSTNERLEELIQVLRGSKLKLLLTTTGRSASLRQVIPLPETMMVDDAQLRVGVEGLDRQDFWTVN